MMTTDSSSVRWRLPLLLAGVLVLLGGPRHPGGTMAEMLAHPDWVPGHVLVTAGFAALLAGLVLLARSGTVPAPGARWLRFAIAATVLQTVEMVVHTASVVDHGNLVAGRATPVLSTHLALAVAFYPAFGAAAAGLILTAARTRAVGSWWIAWLGVAGAVAHGASAPLTILTGDERFRILFPGVALFALWMVLAALWPLRARAAAAPRHAAPLPAAARS